MGSELWDKGARKEGGKTEGMQVGDSREQHALLHGLRQTPGRARRLVQRLQVVDDGHGAAQRAKVTRRVMHQVLRTSNGGLCRICLRHAARLGVILSPSRQVYLSEA